MNRIAMTAALVGLSAAPAFAASQSNNTPVTNPPAQQQQLNARQAQNDNASQAQNNAGSQANGNHDQNTAMNQHGNNGNGQALASQSADQRHRRTVANRETKALNMLEAHGFTQFTDFHRIHNGLFGARVDRSGRWMSVQVNPLDNQIMRG
jgi:hypothetical protein